MAARKKAEGHDVLDEGVFLTPERKQKIDLIIDYILHRLVNYAERNPVPNAEPAPTPVPPPEAPPAA